MTIDRNLPVYLLGDMLEKLKSGLQWFVLMPNCFIYCLRLLCSGLIRCNSQGCIRKGSPVLLEGWCLILLQFLLLLLGIVLLLSWRWQLSPTPVVRFASLWIDKITIRSLIFWSCWFHYSNSNYFYFMILMVLGNVHCICN